MNYDNYQLIIIIGLPGSGKTTLSNKMTDHIIFDDFITHFYNGNLIKELQTNKKLCINDPRLCHFDIFNKYITIINKYIDKSNILLLLFQNDITNCINNLKKTYDGKLLDSKITSLNNYSKLYDPNNYSQWIHQFLNIFCI